MTICQNNHEAIVYEGEGSCPLCVEIVANKLLQGENDWLVREVKMLEEKIKELKQEVKV